VLPSPDEEQTDLLISDAENRLPHASRLKDLAHAPRTETTENYRTPIVWAFNLRKTILSPRIDLSILPMRALQVNEELRILDMVSKFVAAWEDMHKLATTPFAFPLAQMTRTFLFFWVFSLPLVLIKDDSNLWATFLVVFGITYGFFGLEYVSLELSDPYGSDPNDFPGM
jgi:predicted membrane chloride channel (bestrophin family)